MKNIPQKLYDSIKRTMPILCVDIQVFNKNGEFLLVKRKNNPLLGQYHFLGGRVIKGENLIQAVKRKAKEESGLRVSGISFVGYSDYKYKTKDGLLHTPTLTFSCLGSGKVKLDKQSSNFMWTKKLPKYFKLS